MSHDEKMWLAGWTNAAWLIGARMTEAETHEMARGAARLIGADTTEPRYVVYWQGLSAGLAAAVGA